MKAVIYVKNVRITTRKIEVECIISNIVDGKEKQYYHYAEDRKRDGKNKSKENMINRKHKKYDRKK